MKPILPKNATKGCRKNTLAHIAARPCEHQRMQACHIGHCHLSDSFFYSINKSKRLLSPQYKWVYPAKTFL